MRLRRSPIYGWGINDADYVVASRNHKCKYYTVWTDMIRRCYSKKCLEKHPTYGGCSIHSDWKYFSNFKKWMEKQDWKGKFIDKDLLFPGNKVYGPDTCVFVTRQLNNLFTDHGGRGPHKQGVYKHGRGGMYVAQISRYGKQKEIGYYDNEEAAYECYKKARREYLIEVANKQKDDRLVNALMQSVELYI